MRDLLPSLTNLPVFYTILVTLLLMLLLAGMSLYLNSSGDTTNQRALIWSKLCICIPLLALGATWTYLGTFTFVVVALMGGGLKWISIAFGTVIAFVVTTWGLIWWILNKRFGDISVIVVVVAFISGIYIYQRAWLCEPLAHSGYGFAQLCTAQLYETGTGGVTARRGIARDWYRDAAYNGYATAQYWVGMRARDLNERKQWLKQAAVQGHVPAAYQMSLLLRAEDDQALEWLQFAVDKDYPPALYRLGLLHSNGDRLAHDLERTREFWHRAAQRGHTTTMRVLALEYVRGVIFDIDLDASREWEQKAIAASANESIKNLTANEEHLAKTWQVRLAKLRNQAGAIAANNTAAVRQLSSDILAQAKDDPAQRKKGILLLEQAAEDDPTAQYEVADYYLGLESPTGKDTKKGLLWLTKAAESGHRRALRRITKAHKEGQYGLAIDLYQAKHYSERFFAVLEENDVAQNNTAWLGPSWDYQDTLNQIKRIEGLPVPIDQLKEKADAGDPEAQYYLAKDIAFYGNDFETMIALLEASARGGYPQAQFEMSSNTFQRKHTNEEERQAMRWLIAAAQSGHRGAMVGLGNNYMSGFKRQQIERNYYQAKLLYERAIEGIDDIVYEQKTSPTHSWNITVDSVKRRLNKLPDYIMRLDLEGLEGQRRITAINEWYEQERSTLDAKMNSAGDDELPELITALFTLQSQHEILLKTGSG